MGTLRVVLNQSIGTNQIRNVYYVAGAYAEIANAQSIVDYFRDGYVQVNSLNGVLMPTWSLDDATVKDVADPANPTIPYQFTSGSVVGTANGEELPNQTAMLLQFKATTAPPNRKRVYLGGFGEIHHDASGWVSSAITGATTYAQWLLDIDTNLDPGIDLTVTRIDKVTGVLVGSNILDSFKISAYARTQRRRTPGRGI